MRTHLPSRRVAFGAGLTILAVALAACGGGNAAPSSVPASAPASAASAPATKGSARASASASATSNAKKGQLGMVFEVNNSGWQKILGSAPAKGMVVVMVIPNGPGAKAGIKNGDVVTKMNGVSTTNANMTNLQISKLKVGDKVALDIQRTAGPAKADVQVEAVKTLNLPKLLDQQIQAAPNDPRGYFLRGAYADKTASAGLADYTKAIQLDDAFVSAYVQRGTLEEKSNPKQAMTDFNKAASLDPNYEPLYVNRSVLLSSQKKYAQALQDDKKAVQLDPSDPAAYANLGIGYVNTGNPAQALAAENNALKRDAQFGPALLYRGLLQRDAAKADLQQAVKDLQDPSLKAVAQSALQKMP